MLGWWGSWAQPLARGGAGLRPNHGNMLRAVGSKGDVHLGNKGGCDSWEGSHLNSDQARVPIQLVRSGRPSSQEGVMSRQCTRSRNGYQFMRVVSNLVRNVCCTFQQKDFQTAVQQGEAGRCWGVQLRSGERFRERHRKRQPECEKW